MSVFPPAVIAVNPDLTDGVESKLIRQLYIDEVIDGYTFDDRVSLDSSYVSNVKLTGKRILVVRNLEDWDITQVDLVLYIKYGLVNVKSADGHSPTFTLENLNWKELGFTDGSHSIM